MSDEHRRWRRALDAFAAGLESARAALATGESGPGSAWPPPDLPSGPPPAELVEEARALLAQADAVTVELADALARTEPPPRRAHRSGGTTGSATRASWAFSL